MEESSWAEIDQIGQLGLADDYWSIGDKKDITANNETVTVEILGFNHDRLSNGGNANYTFGLKNLMSDLRKINSVGMDPYVYSQSDIYLWLKTDLYSSLPEDLQAVIKTVEKRTGGNHSLPDIADDLEIFLFSEIEVFGTASSSANGEGTQYSRFASSDSRIKKQANGVGNTEWWGLRSPDNKFSFAVLYVNDSGQLSSDGPNLSAGVCFGFCV